ncbi:MAG: hypothetical protein RXR51_06090 [Nitrososphaeria archaeon]
MYVGLDLHKATINATVMNKNGTELNEVKIKSANSLRNFSDSIPLGSYIAIAPQHGTGHIGYCLKGTTLPYQTH